MKPNFLKILGQVSFYVGGFFLVSAFPLSALFFLLSIFISFLGIQKIEYRNKYHLILLISGLLMILKNIAFEIPNNITYEDFTKNMWLDLVNWIPFFIFFISSQIYLRTINQRKLFSKFLIAGSVPLIISCLLQAWFKLYGPFEAFNGLVIWYQRPIGENHLGVTGLFNNQNYTGLWLTAIVPLLISEIKLSKSQSKIFLYSFLFLDIYLIFLTTSKNAFFGLIIILIMLFDFRSKFFKISSLLLASFLIFLKIFNNKEILNISFIPFHLYEKISSFNFFNSSRYEIFKISSRLISERPFFGWGKSLFSDLYILNGGNYPVEHTHSMPLEIAFNYGIPISILLFSFITILIIKTWIRINLFQVKDETKFINKCWLVSTITVVISHLNDITYYDGKISIFVWTLLIGTKCILDNNKIYEKFEK